LHHEDLVHHGRIARPFGLRIARLALEQGDNLVATARRAETVTEALGERDHLLALALDVTDEVQAAAPLRASTAPMAG
jgi:NADP-dependent 3-hydroxy acid dehydrogenase YdfG